MPAYERFRSWAKSSGSMVRSCCKPRTCFASNAACKDLLCHAPRFVALLSQKGSEMSSSAKPAIGSRVARLGFLSPSYKIKLHPIKRQQESWMHSLEKCYKLPLICFVRRPTLVRSTANTCQGTEHGINDFSFTVFYIYDVTSRFFLQWILCKRILRIFSISWSRRAAFDYGRVLSLTEKEEKAIKEKLE